jgi:hypothetical protein
VAGVRIVGCDELNERQTNMTGFKFPEAFIEEVLALPLDPVVSLGDRSSFLVNTLNTPYLRQLWAGIPYHHRHFKDGVYRVSPEMMTLINKYKLLFD